MEWVPVAIPVFVIILAWWDIRRVLPNKNCCDRVDKIVEWLKLQYKWNNAVDKAICQLENYHLNGVAIEAKKTLCYPDDTDRIYPPPDPSDF